MTLAVKEQNESRSIGGMILRGEIEEMQEKPVRVSLHTPQIPIELLGERGQGIFIVNMIPGKGAKGFL